MPDEPRFAIPETVLFRKVDEQMVLLNLETEQYYGLNATGADIVTRLTSQPFTAAFAAITTDYGVDPDVLRRDVDDLVETLVQAGLLHCVEPSS